VGFATPIGAEAKILYKSAFSHKNSHFFARGGERGGDGPLGTPDLNDTILSPSDSAIQMEMHGDPTGMPQSLRIVSLRLPATQTNGRIFMPRKDSPFPFQIAEMMAFLAQSATTMKSTY
jgi:hypothetical protein